jgi:thioredoxin-related protein
VYSTDQVRSFITDHFVPLRVHVRENAETWRQLSERYGVQWTPTILLVDPDGTERHRIEGFLPVDDFLSQLALGEAHAAFKRNDYQTAERLFREVADRFNQTDASAEALYWAGVSKYRAANDPGALAAAAALLRERYPSSTWTKKASVWEKPA